MGIQDRDYMRERGPQPKHRRPQRWRQSVPGQARRWRIVALVLALVGVVTVGSCLSRIVPSAAPVVAPAVAPPRSGPVERPPAPAAQSSDNPVLVGTVTRVVDGDTIEAQLDSGPINVRLGSIDAPEKNQPFGKQSSAALARKLGHAEVALEVVEQKDHYDRLVAVVYLGDENVNQWMVEQGNAWAYRQYLEDPQYCRWEFEAHSGGRGLWGLPAAETHAPWEWRAKQRHQLQEFRDYSKETVRECIDDWHGAKRRAKPTAVAASTTQSSPNGNCRIKGNISSSGRIYHLPGSVNYDRTVIDTGKGEKWFCSEAEAKAAGWRAPRG